MLSGVLEGSIEASMETRRSVERRAYGGISGRRRRRRITEGDYMASGVAGDDRRSRVGVDVNGCHCKKQQLEQPGLAREARAPVVTCTVALQVTVTTSSASCQHRLLFLLDPPFTLQSLWHDSRGHAITRTAQYLHVQLYDLNLRVTSEAMSPGLALFQSSYLPSS